MAARAWLLLLVCLGCDAAASFGDGRSPRLATAGAAGIGSGGGGFGGTPSGGAGGADAGLPECLSSNDCGPPRPYCVSGACVECITPTNCNQSAAGRFCNASTHTCVRCLSSNNCGTVLPYCAPSGLCVECLSKQNCGAANMNCDPLTNTCRALCSDSAPCATGKCDPMLNECVDCLTDQDCPDGGAPHCDATETCVQ